MKNWLKILIAISLVSDLLIIALGYVISNFACIDGHAFGIFMMIFGLIAPVFIFLFIKALGPAR